MKKTPLVIIFFTVFIDLMGFGILIPLLPSFASEQLGISDFGIGILVASFSLIQFIFNPILGSLSDRYGRRPIIVLSLLFTVASYILFSFATSFLILLISRVLGGLGGSNIAVAQAYIADITEKHERSKGMGIIGAAFGLGFVFGPLIGGILSDYFIAGITSAGFSFLAFLFASLFLRESLQVKDVSKNVSFKLLDLPKVSKVLRQKDLGIMIILFFAVTFSFANTYGIFALLGFKHYGFSNRQIGYQYAILGIVSAIIQGGFIKKISQKISEKNIIITGTFLIIFGLGLMPYGHNFLGLAIVVSVLSVGSGILNPTILSMISKYSPQDEQGTVLGINQSLSALARVLGPLWGGFTFDYLGHQYPFLSGAFIMLIVFLFSIFILSKNKYLSAQNSIESLKEERIGTD